MVQFHCSKFRISLPSRRELKDDDPSSNTIICSDHDEKSQGVSKFIVPIVEDCCPKTSELSDLCTFFKDKNCSWEQVEKTYEYVFFNEDLFFKLNNILNVITEKNNKHTQVVDDNQISKVNFRCMVSNIYLLLNN